jgi:hypothetical protein
VAAWKYPSVGEKVMKRGESNTLHLREADLPRWEALETEVRAAENEEEVGFGEREGCDEWGKSQIWRCV